MLPVRFLLFIRFYIDEALIRDQTDSALATLDHHHHKLRRGALNPFFSTQSVRKLQPIVEERTDALLDALVNYAASRSHEPLNTMYPFSAFTNGTQRKNLLMMLYNS